MSCDEQKKYLIKEPHDELDKLGLMTSEYIRQKYVFNDPRFSKTKFNERERALRERVAYIDAHKKEEIAALREEVYGEPNPYRKVTCPPVAAPTRAKSPVSQKRHLLVCLESSPRRLSTSSTATPAGTSGKICEVSLCLIKNNTTPESITTMS